MSLYANVQGTFECVCLCVCVFCRNLEQCFLHLAYRGVALCQATNPPGRLVMSLHSCSAASQDKHTFLTYYLQVSQGAVVKPLGMTFTDPRT